MVDSALRSSRRMSRLVADLLLLARADAGRVGAHRRCDLAEVAGNAAAEVGAGDGRTRAARSTTSTRSGSRATPTSCTGWSSTCSTTPPATRRRARRIELRLRAEGGDAVVEVADDGPGHPARAARPDLRPLRPRRGPGRHRRRPRQRPRPGDRPRRRHLPRRHGRGRRVRARRRALPRPPAAAQDR